MDEFQNDQPQQNNSKKPKTVIKYLLPTVLLIGILYFLASGLFAPKDTIKEIDDAQNSAKKTTTTVMIKSAGSSDASVSSKNVVVLGLGDIRDNFDKIYGKPVATDLGFEYKFIGGKIVVTFAPDVNKTDRAWQLFITQQKPTSRNNAMAYSKKFIPEDAKLIASGDKDLSGLLLEYNSQTLASLYTSDMFTDENNKPDPGYFRIMLDIDESNLVYQIRIVGGYIDF